LHNVASKNYTKISEEFAKSQQQYMQAISGLQQAYLESAKITFETTITIQKEYFSNPSSRYQIPNTANANMENMIDHSNEYTRNLINWMNIQNQLMAKNIEVLKEYVKSYNSAILSMAEYHSNLIKRSNSSGSKVK
jgi:hypothetical protein